jgi:hypothetical protein
VRFARWKSEMEVTGHESCSSRRERDPHADLLAPVNLSQIVSPEIGATLSSATGRIAANHAWTFWNWAGERYDSRRIHESVTHSDIGAGL